MINNKFFQNDRGFTLIEVLLSITILGIILISTMSFFSQAYSYTNMNEKKTVGINVARNALMYMEKQNFLEIREYFLPVLDGGSQNSKELSLFICTDSDTSRSYRYFTKENTVPNSCDNIKINEIEYTVTIRSSKQIENRSFFIPMLIEVTWNVNGKNLSTILEGNLKSEDIR